MSNIADEESCLVVGRPVHVEQLDDVGVGAELLQKDNFAKSSLSIRSIAKGVENLLDRHHRARLPIGAKQQIFHS